MPICCRRARNHRRVSKELRRPRYAATSPPMRRDSLVREISIACPEKKGFAAFQRVLAGEQRRRSRAADEAKQMEWSPPALTGRRVPRSLV